MSFWNDFVGSLKGGSHYGQILDRPLNKGLVYLVILLAVVSLILAISRIIIIDEIYDQAVQFMTENCDTLIFAGGQIANLPPRYIEREFKRWSVKIDSGFIDSNSVIQTEKSAPDEKPCLYIGPKASFIITSGKPVIFNYPDSFSSTLTARQLARWKIYFLPGALLTILLFGFIFIFFRSLFYVLIIGLMMVFKFRNIGLRYKNGFHLGLYLVTIQVVASFILSILNISLPYDFLWCMIFYILYIGLMVNISTKESPQMPSN